MRRYNADLANDFGNLLNRTLNMTGRYLDGERVPPVAGAASELGQEWAETWPLIERAMERFLLGDALAALGEFVGAANRFVDAEQPWQLAKAAKNGDADGTKQAAARCWATCSRHAASCRWPTVRSCRPRRAG